MVTALVLSGLVVCLAWMWLQLAKREVSLPIWSTLDVPELAEADSPYVSIIATPRGDEQGLERCVQSLLRQDYPRYEVIMAASPSAETWQQLQAIKTAGEVPLHILLGDQASSQPPWQVAVQQGLEEAQGDWLLFTTPDTYHAPALLSRAMTYARLQGLGLLSVAPRYECRAFWEHVWHPVALQYLDFVMPMERVGEDETTGVWASAAFVLVSREAYTKAGGYEAVASEADPEGALMRRVKALGYRVEFVKAMDLLQVRPYRTFGELWDGWGRELYRRLGARPFRVMAHAVAIWIWTVLPFAALVPAFSFGFWGLDAIQGWWDVVLAVSAILAVVTILQAQSVSRRVLRQNHFYTATLPLGGLCLGAATIWSVTRGTPQEGRSAPR